MPGPSYKAARSLSRGSCGDGCRVRCCSGQVGEQLLLTCVETDVRGGLYRLEEALQPGAAPAAASEGLRLLGEEAAGEDDEEPGAAARTGLEGAELAAAGQV